tara:strand:+ start:1427 stop:1996 length:570 start_codon:yes stop_codon:yes gene_type:complete
MAIQNVNTLPYDFKVTDQAGLTSASSSIKSVAAGGDKLAFGIDTTNHTLAASTGGDLYPVALQAKFYFDFATDGGAVGAITLRGPKLPIGAIITNGVLYNTTAWTSGGSATISLGILVDDVAGIKAATAVATVGAAGPIALIQTGAAATASEITTAERDITMTIAVAALTAGASCLVVDYVVVKADTSS